MIMIPSNKYKIAIYVVHFNNYNRNFKITKNNKKFNKPLKNNNN